MTKEKQPTIGERYEAKRLKHLYKWQKEIINNQKIEKDNGGPVKNYDYRGRNREKKTNLVREQDHKCAICGNHLPERNVNTHWDHCHKTNKLRGVLCANCNIGLGQFKDNVTSLEKAINYLNYWKDAHEMKNPYKYSIIDQKPIYNGRVSYLIQHIAKNGGIHEEWIGIVKMSRLIKQERIINPPAKLENYRNPETGEIKTNNAPNQPKMYSLPDVWIVPALEAKPQINIKAYCYMTPDNRWHVIMNNGTEDEDTYPTEKWAKEMVEMYNNPSSGEESS